MRRARVRAAVAAIGAMLLVCAGCADTAATSWRLVTPTGVRPESMFAGPAGWFVGGTGNGPVLVMRDGDGGGWRDVPTAAASGYGRMATLVHVAADPAGRIVAMGTAIGGAHLNPRWSIWLGSAAGIAEEPQTVETFGGPDAGGISGVVYGTDPGVVGAWSLGPGATGVAVWRPDGLTWLRRPSSPVFVGSPPTLLDQRAVLWRTDARDDDSWIRVDLDRSGTASAATDVTCAGADCVVVGRLAGALAAWQVTGDAVEPIDLPRRAVDRYTAQPRVAFDGRTTAIAVGDGSGLLTREGAGEWVAAGTPAGEVRGIGMFRGRVVLLQRDGTGGQQLYER